MKDIFKVIGGLLLILWDFITIPFRGNISLNFKKFIACNNFFLNFFIIFGAFLLISHWSILLALTSIMLLPMALYKFKGDLYYKQYNKSMSADSIALSGIITFMFAFISVLVILDIDYYKEFTEIGTVTIDENDLNRDYIDVEYKGNKHEIKIANCNIGEHKIYKIGYTAPWVTLHENRIELKCKRVKSIKEIKGGLN